MIVYAWAVLGHESRGHVTCSLFVMFRSVQKEMENSKPWMSCPHATNPFLFAHERLKKVTVYVYIILLLFMSGTKKRNNICL